MAVFDWVLALIAAAGLVKGDRIAVDLDTGAVVAAGLDPADVLAGS